MKVSFLFTLFLSLASLAFSQDFNKFYDDADQFFKQHTKNNLLDYKGIKANPKTLNALCSFLDTTDPSSLEPEAKKAYLINAYNLLTIQTVVNNYPTSSPRNVSGFFDRVKISFAGKKTTLNDLEKEQLFKVYGDPRLHFVLVCAAKGCPPIASYAYRPDLLEAQLEERTKLALNDPAFIRVTDVKEMYWASEIFNWYANDFQKEAGTITKYINQYREVKIPENYKKTFYDYDWRLNDQNPVPEEGDSGFQPYQASALLEPGQIELKLFQGVYTQKNFDGFSSPNSRSTYFTSFNSFHYGLKKVNVGFDFLIQSYRTGDFASDSPLGVFKFQNLDGQNLNDLSLPLQYNGGGNIPLTARFGPTHIGPKIKFQPFKKFEKLTVQQTVFVPFNKKVSNQWISFSQIFYDQSIGTDFGLFVEVAWWQAFAPNPSLSRPFLRGFLSYFPNDKWTFYAMANVPTEYGAGVKYQIHPKLNIEFLYTHYLPFEKLVGDSRPLTFGLGFRYTNFSVF